MVEAAPITAEEYADEQARLSDASFYGAQLYGNEVAVPEGYETIEYQGADGTTVSRVVPEGTIFLVNHDDPETGFNGDAFLVPDSENGGYTLNVVTAGATDPRSVLENAAITDLINFQFAVSHPFEMGAAAAGNFVPLAGIFIDEAELQAQTGQTIEAFIASITDPESPLSPAEFMNQVMPYIDQNMTREELGQILNMGLFEDAAQDYGAVFNIVAGDPEEIGAQVSSNMVLMQLAAQRIQEVQASDENLTITGADVSGHSLGGPLAHLNYAYLLTHRAEFGLSDEAFIDLTGLDPISSQATLDTIMQIASGQMDPPEGVGVENGNITFDLTDPATGQPMPVTINAQEFIDAHNSLPEGYISDFTPENEARNAELEVYAPLLMPILYTEGAEDNYISDRTAAYMQENIENGALIENVFITGNEEHSLTLTGLTTHGIVGFANYGLEEGQEALVMDNTGLGGADGMQLADMGIGYIIDTIRNPDLSREEQQEAVDGMLALINGVDGQSGMLATLLAGQEGLEAEDAAMMAANLAPVIEDLITYIPYAPEEDLEELRNVDLTALQSNPAGFAPVIAFMRESIASGLAAVEVLPEDYADLVSSGQAADVPALAARYGMAEQWQAIQNSGLPEEDMAAAYQGFREQLQNTAEVDAQQRAMNLQNALDEEVRRGIQAMANDDPLVGLLFGIMAMFMGEEAAQGMLVEFGTMFDMIGEEELALLEEVEQTQALVADLGIDELAAVTQDNLPPGYQDIGGVGLVVQQVEEGVDPGAADEVTLWVNDRIDLMLADPNVGPEDIPALLAEEFPEGMPQTTDSGVSFTVASVSSVINIGAIQDEARDIQLERTPATQGPMQEPAVVQGQLVDIYEAGREEAFRDLVRDNLISIFGSAEAADAQMEGVMSVAESWRDNGISMDTGFTDGYAALGGLSPPVGIDAARAISQAAEQASAALG